MNDRKFLMDWLVDNARLRETDKLERMTNDELYQYTMARKEELTASIDAKTREAKALREYGEKKFGVKTFVRPDLRKANETGAKK